MNLPKFRYLKEIKDTWYFDREADEYEPDTRLEPPVLQVSYDGVEWHDVPTMEARRPKP